MFVSLSKLKIEVNKSGIACREKYLKHRKINWPSDPGQYYKKEWVSWGDLFGKKKIEFISLSQLKVEVKKVGINSSIQYYKHRSPNWPSRPYKYYKEEWIDWPNLFDRKKIEYVSLSQLKIEVKKAGVECIEGYKKHRKPNWPSVPDQHYKKEWISFNNLFGREEIEFISLKQLKIEVKKAGIKTYRDYVKHRKSNWPSRPDQHYKKEWISLNNLFGREEIEFISLKQLKIEVKKAGIKNRSEYHKYRKPNWPSNPNQHYDEWIGFSDLFDREFISLEQLKIEVKKAGIISEKEYRIYRKPNWPSAPYKYYKEQWIGWNDLFGKVVDLKRYIIRKLGV